MGNPNWDRWRGARTCRLLATVVGVTGFLGGWMVSFQHLGWGMALLVGWWPALMLGAGAAWLIGIGVPGLGTLIERASMRSAPAVHPGDQGQDRKPPGHADDRVKP
jgi:hypothetical protein